MPSKIIAVDFTGTLIKAEVVEEANELRAKILKRSLPTKEEHSKPEELYKANRDFVEKLTGLKKDMRIRYRENDLDILNLTAEQVENQIATNLFQIGMYMAAKKYRLDIFQPGFISQLKRIKELGYKLAIISGVRTDIISGMLEISELDLEFDYIYAQPPRLGIDNTENLKQLKQHGDIIFLIGDKIQDIEPAKEINAKSIFVKWGHPAGKEEDVADFTINKPEELKDIIN